MAGELCGANCGYCGRCDAGYDEAPDDDREPEPEPEPFCTWCQTIGCDGTCPAYYAGMDAALAACEARCVCGVRVVDHYAGRLRRLDCDAARRRGGVR